MKNRKIIFILLILLVLFILALVFLILSKFIIRSVDAGTFTEYNSSKMVKYLENKYDIKFPNDTKDIKSAKSGIAEGYSWFILKFTADPNEIEKFFKKAVSISLHPLYSPGDSRFLEHESVPEWWTNPIEKGKCGYIYVKVKNNDKESRIDVYLDTSNEKKSVIYLRGWYLSGYDY